MKRCNLIGPGFELRAILLRETKHVRDNHRRQRVPKIANQIDTPRWDDRVDQVINNLLDVRVYRLDNARREGFARNGADARVVWRVKTHLTGGEMLVQWPHLIQGFRGKLIQVSSGCADA
jgi:hypothetical protein